MAKPLYQAIMDVPGLSGTWQNRLKQYYKNLTGKTYTGTKDQGLYMLGQIASKNYSMPQTQTKTDPIQTIVNNVVDQVKKMTPFSDVYGSEQNFVDKQKALSEAGVAQQTNKNFMPQIDKGVADIRSAFASRGLFRSGIRGKAEGEFLTDIADQEGVMREQLLGGREDELRKRYQKMQSDYELAQKQGNTYTPTDAALKPDWTMPVQQKYTPYSVNQDRYSPIGSTIGGQSNTSRFGEAYRRWYEDRFKKTRPDVSYNNY